MSITCCILCLPGGVCVPAISSLLQCHEYRLGELWGVFLLEELANNFLNILRPQGYDSLIFGEFLEQECEPRQGNVVNSCRPQFNRAQIYDLHAAYAAFALLQTHDHSMRATSGLFSNICCSGDASVPVCGKDVAIPLSSLNYIHRRTVTSIYLLATFTPPQRTASSFQTAHRVAKVGSE